jgi:hypothetical protein
MKKNTGNADRVIRFIVALVLIDVLIGKTIPGFWNVVVDTRGGLSCRCRDL